LHITDFNVDNQMKLEFGNIALVYIIKKMLLVTNMKILALTTIATWLEDGQNMITYHEELANAQHLQATIGIVFVTNFVSPIITISDEVNTVAHSCLLMPPWTQWSNFFVKIAKELLAKAD